MKKIFLKSIINCWILPLVLICIILYTDYKNVAVKSFDDYIFAFTIFCIFNFYINIFLFDNRTLEEMYVKREEKK